MGFVNFDLVWSFFTQSHTVTAAEEEAKMELQQESSPSRTEDNWQRAHTHTHRIIADVVIAGCGNNTIFFSAKVNDILCSACLNTGITKVGNLSTFFFLSRRETLLRCSQCKMARYCSATCQVL